MYLNISKLGGGYYVRGLAKLIKKAGFKGLIKSVYWNLRLLPVKQALYLPLILGRDCKLCKCKRGNIRFECDKIKPGILVLGIESLDYPSKGTTTLIIDGKLTVKGSGSHWFGSNGYLVIRDTGTLTIGNELSMGNGWRIYVSSSTSVGDDCMFSWDIQIFDTDCHRILDRQGVLVNNPEGCTIGNHVWIGMSSTILKGATIPEGCVVAAKSVVTKKLMHTHSIYSGNRVIKEEVNWLRDPI